MNKSEYTPPFGSQLGFWYPLVWRLLSSNKYWCPAMWLPKNSGLVIDIYVTFWWMLELSIVCLYEKFSLWEKAYFYWIIIIFCFRFIDIIFVLLSILLKGFYRRKGEWLSANRLILFTMANTFEIIIIFSIFYHSLAFNYPQAVAFEPSIKNLFEAIYFSVVTGSTLGYGFPHPTAWGAQVLVIVETLSIFLIVIALIGFLVSARKPPKDKEFA